MTRPLLPPSPRRPRRGTPEHNEQTALFDWLRLHAKRHPALAWVHSSLNGVRLSPREIEKAHRGGMVAGVWDVFIPCPNFNPPYSAEAYGCYIEMKAPGKYPSAEQKAFRAFAEPQGYRFVVCRSWVHAAREILSYLGIEDEALTRQLWLNEKPAVPTTPRPAKPRRPKGEVKP